MRGMAMTLPDEQAMKDVIAYITTLSSQTAAHREVAATSMGKERPPDELAQRIFLVTIVGTILWVACVVRLRDPRGRGRSP